MASWRYDTHEDQPWDMPDMYQASVDREFRLRRELGDHSTLGWRRPVDPPCPQHGYGMVEGLCGVCVLELREKREAA